MEKDNKGQVKCRKLFLSVSVPEVHPPIKNDTTLPSKLIGGGIKNDGETNKSITVKEKDKKVARFFGRFFSYIWAYYQIRKEGLYEI